ncbi:hypothetical protein AFE02nite_01970 [Actinotalea fermentans]|uniref:Uncharacterized protein n=1 Tax=Actinotalea fermentans TaxID=43671 RepID=A0A511YTE6_9CELL|nr:hypothetical protein AFE02nite_01970 [Actinotalea fermentans]
MPDWDASQCVEATIPCVPRSSGRVVNVTGLRSLDDARGYAGAAVLAVARGVRQVERRDAAAVRAARVTLRRRRRPGAVGPRRSRSGRVPGRYEVRIRLRRARDRIPHGVWCNWQHE